MENDGSHLVFKNSSREKDMAKIKGADIFIIVAGTFSVVMALIMYSEVFPELNSSVKNFSNSMIQFGLANGLWAAFVLSMFGNTSVFLVFPYSYIIWVLAATGGNEGVAILGATWAYPLILGILSGIGAGVGEVTSYIVGRLFTKSEKLQNSDLGQKFERMRHTFEKHPKMIPFVVFLFALTPLPDDAILVPFGVMKYSYWKTIIPCMLGKMCLTTGLAFAGYYIADVVVNSPLSFIVPNQEANPGDDMLNLLVLFIIIYLMLRVDFGKMLERKEKPPREQVQVVESPREAVLKDAGETPEEEDQARGTREDDIVSGLDSGGS